MDEQTATARIGALADWDGDPVLGDVEKAMVLDRARLADRYGVYPAEDGWEPTWDLYGAAALGWELKAAKAANRTDVSLGDVSMKRATVHEHCLEMARRYGRKTIATIRTTPSVVHPAGDARWP